MKKLAALSLILVALMGCSAQKGKGGNNGYTILKQGAYGGREVAGNETITSQAQLSKIYSELNLEDVPAIDFSKNNVVALFLGQKRTGGYGIGIDTLEVKNNTVVVKVLKSKPDGGIATMALTAPYCIASIPKTDKVIFE
jgi:hypothetical protein